MLIEQEIKEEKTYNYRQATDTQIVTHRSCSRIRIEYFRRFKIHDSKRQIYELSNQRKAQNIYSLFNRKIMQLCTTTSTPKVKYSFLCETSMFGKWRLLC